MPISIPPGEVEPGTKELRLAVVCYGGVSLAIYMHGVTRELQSLFRASETYAASHPGEGAPDQSENPFDEATTERGYWEALRQAHVRDKGMATRVVIDIVSGTSAGGINGVVLAKALSEGEAQDKLRDIWINEGSVAKLVNPFAGAPRGLRGRIAALTTFARGLKEAPLNGNFLLSQVFEALEQMDEARAEAGAPTDRGKGPSPWPVELHVTLTDFYGFPQAAPAWDPKTIRDLRHRYVLSFRTKAPRTERDQFGRADNRALAFAARATSSFPGAFPPTRISDVERLGGPWEGLRDFLDDYWAIYKLSGADAEETAFVDGGVLDNAPFGLAIAAIEQRPATSQVDRRLLYIQPDPQEPKATTDGSAPGWMKTVWGGLSGIPRSEPILNDLLEVRAYNEKAERVRDIVASAHVRAQERLPQLPDVEHIDAVDDELHTGLAGELVTEAPYRHLKLFAVIDRLGDVTCEMLNFPPESNHAFFVRDVLLAWARRERLLDTDPAAWDEVQLPFLKAFDLGYRERRLRFVIQGVNELYEKDGAEHADQPTRDQLDTLKRALYGQIWELTKVARAARDGAAGTQLQALFTRERVERYLALHSDPDRSVRAFLVACEDELTAVRDLLAAFLVDALDRFTRTSYDVLHKNAPTGWPAEARDALLRRYAAFPLYDRLLFPIRALSGLGELDRIEVIRLSPLDARLLPVPGVEGRPATVADKLRGAAAGHFAAFFARDKRENDYLWGRLDAVERLIWLVVGTEPSAAYKLGLSAVLSSESGKLSEVEDLMEKLGARLSALPKVVAAAAPD